MGEKAKNILLVEDEIFIAVAQSKMLENHGYAVTMVHSGEEAVELVQTNGQIDLILMDIDLGSGMDGTEAAKRILEKRDVPVVFLSSHTEPEIVEKTEKITSYGYVVKNSGETVLLTSVKMAFRLHEAKRELDAKNQELTQANEELQSTVEELEATFEELEATNEELSRSQDELIANQQVINFERAQLIAILETIPESIYVCDMDTYEILYVNKTLRDVLSGNPVGKRCFHEFQGLSSPCDFCTNAKLRQKPDEVYEWEYFNPKLNRYYYLADQIIQWPDGRKVRLEIAKDVTEQKKNENLLKERDRIMRAIIDASYESIYLLHPDGTIEMSNEIGAAKIGLRKDDAKGKNIFAYFEPDTVPQRKEMLQKVCAEALPVRFVDDDAGKWFENSLYPVLDDDGRVEYVAVFAQDISERKAMESKLKEQAEFLQSLIEAIPNPVFFKDAEMRYTGCNRAFEEFRGLQREEIIGKTVFDISPPELAVIYDAADRELLARPGTQVYESQVELKDGRRSDVIFHKATIRDAAGAVSGIIGVIMDITERKKLESKLRESEKMYRLLAENSTDVIWIMTFEGKFLYASPSVERLAGFTPEEALAIPFEKYVLPEYVGPVMEQIARELSKPPEQRKKLQTMELKQWHKNGSIIDIEITCSFMFDDKGEPVAIQGSTRDISERKESERKLLMAVQESDILREKAERLAAEKDMLLKEVHHRIKNNLATIMSILSLQENYLKDAKSREAVREAHNRVRSMATLYERLYTMEHFKSMPLSNYLPVLVREIVALYSFGSAINVECSIAPIEMVAKKLMPVGIIVNELVTNALKYAFRGRERGTIFVFAEKREKILLTVADDGVGMSKDALEGRLEKEFGLELVRLLVKQLNGSMRIEAENGTRIQIEFE